MTESPSHEEVVQGLIREANTKLIEKINASHGQIESCIQGLIEAIVLSINKARETGLYLIELQDQTAHGKWLSLFRTKANPQGPISFNDVTASRWIRLARALPNPVTKQTLPEGVRHVTDMLRVVHALPEPQGHGDQTAHEARSPFQALVKFAGEIQGCLAMWRKAKPIDQWDDDLKSQVKSQLEPLVKFYKSL